MCEGFWRPWRLGAWGQLSPLPLATPLHATLLTKSIRFDFSSIHRAFEIHEAFRCKLVVLSLPMKEQFNEEFSELFIDALDEDACSMIPCFF